MGRVCQELQRGQGLLRNRGVKNYIKNRRQLFFKAKTTAKTTVEMKKFIYSRYSRMGSVGDYLKERDLIYKTYGRYV